MLMTTNRGTLLRAHTIGEALLLLRHRAHLSRDELAKRSGVAAGTLSRYENDETQKPDAGVLRDIAGALAEALGVELADLWGELGTLLDQVRRGQYADAQAEVLGGHNHAAS